MINFVYCCFGKPVSGVLVFTKGNNYTTVTSPLLVNCPTRWFFRFTRVGKLILYRPEGEVQ